jgi:benzoyl-CoA reductase/2-hydroxyglutaryl-CoA dehydratase subunit BcrC/BadD/HgdB
LATARAEGHKVIGWIGYNVPEELIHACGMIPIRICRGGDNQLAEDGGNYFSTQNCFFLRQTVGTFAANIDPYVAQLDAVATDTTCLQLHRMSSVLSYYFKANVLQIGFPRDPTLPEGREYFAHEVKYFLERLEGIAGHSVDAEQLAASLQLYQRIHSAIRELYRHVAAGTGGLSWREVFEAAHAGFVLDREEYVVLLESWLQELGRVPEAEKAASGEQSARVILVGSNIAPGDTKLIDIIESSGAKVVGDLVWSGLATKMDLEFKQLTLDGLIEGYLDRFPHAALPKMEVETDRKLSTLLDLVRSRHAQGVIYYSLRYCDPFSFKMLSTKEYLKRAKVPLLEVQTDYGTMDLESVRNRVCAFVEMLG